MAAKRKNPVGRRGVSLTADEVINGCGRSLSPFTEEYIRGLLDGSGASDSESDGNRPERILGAIEATHIIAKHLEAARDVASKPGDLDSQIKRIALKLLRADLFLKSHGAAVMHVCFEVYRLRLSQLGREANEVAQLAYDLSWYTMLLLDAMNPGADTEYYLTSAELKDNPGALKRGLASFDEPVELEPVEVEAIRTHCAQLFAFAMRNDMLNKGSASDIIGAYVREAGIVEENVIIELTKLHPTDRVILPTSKAFWKQQAIAAAEDGQADIQIDKRGTIIKASITGKDGEPIAVSRLAREIQATLGQLIMENGKPLRITPAQIYRAFAGLDSEAYVTDQQENEVIRAMDSMLFSSAQLDFTQEIEKHTHLDRQPDYDYSQTKLTGQLVAGMKIEEGGSSYNGRAVGTSYLIYDMPMLFMYSYAVKQIGSHSRALLQSGAADQTLPAGHPDKRPLVTNPRNIIIKRYLIVQIDRIKGHKQAKAQAATKAGKKPPASYTENLTFDTIAAQCLDQETGGDSPKIHRELRIIVERALLDFQHQGAIKKAELYKDGRAYKGVSITV